MNMKTMEIISMVHCALELIEKDYVQTQFVSNIILLIKISISM